MFWLIPMSLILNHKAFLWRESSAFSECTKHRFVDPLFAVRYFSTLVLIIILSTVRMPGTNAASKVVNILWYNNQFLTLNIYPSKQVIMILLYNSQAPLDFTRAETRFRLSPKRTSPFKSAGASVQSITGSRGVRISVSNAGYTPCSEVVWEYWLPTPFASFPFISPPVRHRVPPGFKRTVTANTPSPIYFVNNTSGFVNQLSGFTFAVFTCSFENVHNCLPCYHYIFLFYQIRVSVRQ